ncbi:MAG TPA: J domain-containing protein [Kofleriaceae bacterium]|nr:J domain-containing protein [Kofleriaceae bacterium]
MAARVLRVRCATWDQVEAFYKRKLRRGKYLAMKVPFDAEKNGEITIGLELPNGMVVAIDGTVTSVATTADARTPIEIHLHGMTPEVQARLEALVSDGREDSQVRRAEAERVHRETMTPVVPVEEVAPDLSMSSLVVPESVAEPAIETPPPPPPPSETAAGERFLALEAELRRLRQLPAHEVLGVPWDASPAEVRAAWIALGRRFHPDTVARWSSAALAYVAEELTIHVNRAYDRLRAGLVADGRAAAFGPALHEPRGWLVGFDDVQTGEPRGGTPPLSADEKDAPALAAPRARSSGVRFAVVAEALTEEGLFGDLDLPSPPGGPKLSAGEGEAFERQARSRLAAGDHAAAKEVLAAALHVYPRNRALRALYHVATALEALDAGQVMLATSQLEAALAHDERCVEAASALDELRKGDTVSAPSLRRLFQ